MWLPYCKVIITSTWLTFLFPPNYEMLDLNFGEVQWLFYIYDLLVYKWGTKKKNLDLYYWDVKSKQNKGWL